jgi:ppGpp synthetase/RelA/SpoT-type nucleotidyltranferase
MTEVSEIVEYYSRNFPDRLGKLIRVITTKIEAGLAKDGIPARVASRVKTPESLRGKLEKWQIDPSKQDRIGGAEETLRRISDLAAVRVMTYTESDRARVVNIIGSVFQSPHGVSNFDLEVKEQTDKRIKQDDENHYRATHMMIGLRDNDLSGELSNLKHDQCELQVTSMLAHVWNEIEHDTKYKEKSGALSPDEKSAIHSLGLLTRTGDNIIESLLKSRHLREINEASDEKERNGKFPDDRALSLFLASHFGDSVSEKKIDYDVGSKELLETLQAIGWDHPREICLNLSPNHLAATKSLSNRVEGAQHKAVRNRYNSHSCDLFRLAVYMLKADDLKSYIDKLRGNTRQSSLFRTYTELENGN